MTETSPNSNDGDTWLTHQWIVAGIVSASARFISIAFVDDIVLQQCRRFVVARTLAANQSEVSLDDIKPMYADTNGYLGGCVGTIAKAPLKLLLFPIRKLAAIFTSVRGVPLEVTRMILLGRTVDRFAKSGKLVRDGTFLRSMRRAFDDSFSRMDLRVVQAVIRDALRAAKGWKASATDKATDLAKRQSFDVDELNVDEDVNKGAEKIQSALDRPMITELFADFDRRLDQSLKNQQGKTI